MASECKHDFNAMQYNHFIWNWLLNIQNVRVNIICVIGKTSKYFLHVTDDGTKLWIHSIHYHLHLEKNIDYSYARKIATSNMDVCAVLILLKTPTPTLHAEVE